MLLKSPKFNAKVQLLRHKIKLEKEKAQKQLMKSFEHLYTQFDTKDIKEFLSTDKGQNYLKLLQSELQIFIESKPKFKPLDEL